MKTAVFCVLVCVCVGVWAMPQGFQQEEAKFPIGGNDGGWSVGAEETKGGTKVRVDGQKTWNVTKDGKVQAKVHGHWDRTYGGANHGNRDHKFGISIGGSWRKK